VGAGNAMIIVDETADLKDAADKIMRSKTFDHATSCSTENALAIQEGIYDKMLKELEAVGGYLCNAEEKAKLAKAMWDEKGVLSREIVAQPAEKIARVAGISLPKGKSFLMVEETGIGKGFPFSAEKLSVTMALYKYKEFTDAIELVNRITAHSGPGHSCGIHTVNELRIKELSHRVRVSRIMVRQPQCLANSGAWTNGMPMSMTLGCGTWGGNATSSNVTWEHLLNYTWVSYPIPSTQPSDIELFGNIMYED
jgi:sulfoacetaldehyde dehydrogenase